MTLAWRDSGAPSDDRQRLPRKMNKLRIALDMIKFEHTVFALPFAFIGALLAGRGLPTLWQFVWIVAAMVGGRSAAMTFNRMVDIRYDKMNPRTSGRALPQGTLSMQFAVIFTVGMSALFIFSAWQLNELCFYYIRTLRDSQRLATWR